MLICNQLRLNFEFWRSSFARMRHVQNKTFVIVAAVAVWRSRRGGSRGLISQEECDEEKEAELPSISWVDKGGNFSLTSTALNYM